MIRVSRRVNVSVAAVALLAMILLAAACFPGMPTATPEPAEPAVPPTAVAPLPTSPPTPPLTATPVPPSPTRTPVSAPVVAPQAEETPAAPEAEALTEGQTVSASPVFDNLAQLEERAFSYLSELAVDVGVRTSGTDLEAEAAEFLVARLEGLGYSPEVQEFSWDSPTASLSIMSPQPESLDANILQGTPSGQAMAELVFVGLAKPADIPAEGLDGKVALVERGEITFASKVAEVHNAGAVAAVIFNNNPRGNFRGSLGGRAQIPAVALSRADGQKLKELLDQGETVEATVVVADNAVPSRNSPSPDS